MAALSALKQILLGAIPTFILVWILYFYTTRVFFRPLQKTLQKRLESTVGLRKAAEADLARVEKKTAEYQEALRAARSELYRIQEQERRNALERRAELVRQEQERAQEAVLRARDEIRMEVEAAKKSLAADSEQIALSITQSILKPAAGPLAATSGGSEVSR
jgi:F0F1-type ATP synthase membrane subunit b/b'